MREHNAPREKNLSIEKPDSAFIFKDPSKDPRLLNEETILGKKYKIALELCKETQVVDAKSKSESPTRKPKKVHRPPNKSAMAKIQKKL